MDCYDNYGIGTFYYGATVAQYKICQNVFSMANSISKRENKIEKSGGTKGCQKEFMSDREEDNQKWDLE